MEVIDFNNYTAFQTTKFFKFPLFFTPKRKWTKTYLNCPHFAITSKKNNIWQWLSDGYYFWLSEEFAMWWGKDVRKYEEFAITKYRLSIHETKVLDLMTNTKHREVFERMLLLYNKEYEKAVNEGRENEMDVPTVCSVLTYFRKKLGASWQYQAILACDDAKDYKVKPILMAPNTKKHECYSGVRRSQICIFKENITDIIKKKEPFYPQQYIDFHQSA